MLIKNLKMKKLVLLGVLVFLGSVMFAQTTKTELQMAQDIFGMKKKAMVSNFVNLPQTDVFWSIYDEYEAKRTAFGEKTYENLLEYAGNYVNYSDNRAEVILNNVMAQRKKMEKLLNTYYKKVKKECGTKTATQFYMVQRFFDATIRAEVLGNLPIVE